MKRRFSEERILVHFADEPVLGLGQGGDGLRCWLLHVLGLQHAIELHAYGLEHGPQHLFTLR